MDDRLIKPIRAPLLLKDRLLEDMSSCSSNGFKSFPRRQCCTTVRFRRRQKARADFVKPPANPALSALQSVITAVKRLHFGAAEKMKKNDLSSSFFLFWRRKPERKEIGRWKSFEQLMKEDEWQPAEDGKISCSTDFTASEGGNSSSNLPLPLKNDVVMTPDHGLQITNDEEADSTTCSGGGSDNNSSTQTKKQWTSDQEKEQFSPVSVLDCPFDEEDEVSSPFQHRLALMEGTRKKLLKKIQRFECLAKLEPLNLTRRFESQLESDNEFLDEEEVGEEESDDEKEDDEEALELLDQVNTIMPSYGLKFKADKLMLDFFRERISNDQDWRLLEKQRGESLSHNALVEIARGWMDGHDPLGLFMEKNRKAYVEDMENGGEWKRLDQEYKEVGIEVCDALLNEVLLEIMN
ncbi:hypothetical protein SASPL_112949 [Salvia splendens]|uniref:DUF4378 domain-containing protein n=1 Tax=Salvia splendens TaxID=180675 RepID=A0A8X8YB46_SALSN|nr:uncharacterized protein LOC121800382 [Salvia splendens]KAG6428695.1 hypothetical protein SASPL_112949 [Salvia splendens]